MSLQVEHVGSFPDGFPNTPGTPGTPSPPYADTDTYTVLNMQTGITSGKLTASLYGENLGNSHAVTYVHPEAFVYSRYSVLRPLDLRDTAGLSPVSKRDGVDRPAARRQPKEE